MTDTPRMKATTKNSLLIGFMKKGKLPSGKLPKKQLMVGLRVRKGVPQVGR